MKSAIFKTFLLSLCIIANVHLSYAQTASILPPAKTTFLDANGKPLTGGKVEFFIPNTTTQKTTWQDAAETIPNTNPVILDAAGRGLILGSGSYRQVVKDRNNNLIWDQVTSSTGSGSSGPTATGDGDLVGTIKPWAGMSAPNQYAFAYGQEVSRATFATLFTAITSSQSVFCNSGSPTLSGVSDTTNFWIGMPVELSCVAAGNTTIIAKTVNTVTMAVNANVTTNTTGVFFPWGRGNGSTTFNLPDFRGVVPAGNNIMGGIASSRLTTTYFGVKTPNATGSYGGQESVGLAGTNLPAQTPTGTITNGAITVNGTASNNTSGNTSDVTAGSLLGSYGVAVLSASQASSTFNGTAFAGQNATPFTNVTPTVTTNYIVKTTPDLNSATASGVTDINGMVGSIGCGSGITCTGNVITLTTPPSQNPFIFASSYGVTCNGSTDDSTAMQNAINDADGRTIYMPSGTCRINNQLVAQFANGQTFQPGLNIEGQGGWGATIFDTRESNNCMLLVQGTADNFFAAGVTLKNIKITSNAPSALQCGVEFYRVAYAKMDNVWMQNLTGDGFFLPASAGDLDASFAVTFDRVRMDAVATTAGTWCANFLGPSGGWALSNLRIVDSNFSGCGVASAAVPPTSGGMRAKVLIAQLINSTFTRNNNVDLYLQGADQSSTITIDGTDFENVISSSLPHIYVDGGLRNFRMTNSECLNNDTYQSRGCLWLNTTSAIIGDVIIENIKLRATVGNSAYTAFQVTGALGIDYTIKARNIFWTEFDFPGQVRFSGFRFDPVVGQARMTISALNTVKLAPVGQNAISPMKLKATGEYISYIVPDAGITNAALGGVSPSTSYNFYLYNSAAVNFPVVGAIELSAVAPTNDQGYSVKTGDSSRVYIGSATSDGAGNFQTTATQSSWYNPVTIAGGVSSSMAVYTGINNIGPSFLGTGILTALGINVGSAGSIVVNGGALGTPSSGVGTNLTALNASNLSSGTLPAARTNGHMNGTATNDNAAAGEVGEYVESIIVQGSAAALTTATALTLTSISLTAGDWDVSCVASFVPANTTSVTQFATSLSSVTNTLNSTAGRLGIITTPANVFNGTTQAQVSLPPYRFSLSGTTTVFFVAQSTFTISTNVAYGIIRARRVR